MTNKIKIFKCNCCGKNFNGQNSHWAFCQHCEEMGRTSSESCDAQACCSKECQEKAEENSKSKTCRKF